MSSLCPVLKVLSLRNNEINTSEGFAIVAEHLPPHLQELSITTNDMNDESAAILSHRLPPTLRFLLLNDVLLSANGARAIAEGLRRATNFDYLEVSFNPWLHDEGAFALISVVDSAVEYALFTECGLTDAFLDMCVAELKLPKLLVLSVTVNHFTADGVARFMAKFPHVPVEWREEDKA
ncbi:hypothetical protein H9P43_008580 [Blastocladiella emersonii ATCC 22665]|nr:hypothetical protein H9P43_008580 [Blastocladiella emersonii ATCC 22665]